MTALDFGEHARLAGRLEIEFAHAVGVVVDHALDDLVAIVARFDTEDGAVELVRVVGQIPEVLDAVAPGFVGDRDGVLRALEVLGNDVDRPFFEIVLDHAALGRQPQTEERIAVIVC
jgi:hypothetical protein